MSFFGFPKRNQRYVAIDPHPVERFPDEVHSGSVGQDGFEVLSRASPERSGTRPPVGVDGVMLYGPDESFEQ